MYKQIIVHMPDGQVTRIENVTQDSLNLVKDEEIVKLAKLLLVQKSTCSTKRSTHNGENR